jgi:hypothetical protein
MAELVAIHQDLKNLTVVPTLASDGSGVIKLTGNPTYKPELRLSAAEASLIVKDFTPKPVTPPVTPPPETERQAQVKSMYERLIADKTAGGCKGIYYYQSHDDSNPFGFMNSDNSPRPLMSTIAAFAKAS